MTDLLQKHMNTAYDRWNSSECKGYSKEEFWDTLSADERFSVFIGNFNAQTCNGGMAQWHGNGYAIPEVVSYVLRQCEKIDTVTSKKVGGLIQEFWDFAEHFDENSAEDYEWDEFMRISDKLSGQYYDLDDQFLADAQNYLSK